MNLLLQKCTQPDCEKIQQMQKAAFAALLEKYRDFDTNPACESVERIREKMNQPQTTWYFIISGNDVVGGVRLFEIDGRTMRVSPIFILPEHQNKGYAQAAMIQLERENPQADIWELDTILQEEKLCRLYEKLGYRKTGESYEIKDGMTIVFYKKTMI